MRYHADLRPEVAAWTARIDARTVDARLLEAGVPVGPVNSITDLLADPHLAEREMFQSVPHPTAGPMTLTGPHIRFSATPSRLRTPAPTLGQDNAQVYGQLLGLDASEQERLAAKGVI